MDNDENQEKTSTNYRLYGIIIAIIIFVCYGIYYVYNIPTGTSDAVYNEIQRTESGIDSAKEQVESARDIASDIRETNSGLSDTNRELQENTESISGGIQQASGEIQSAIGAESDSEATLGDMSETIGRINELQQQQQGFIDSASKYNSDAIETDRLIGSTIASGGANIDSMSRRDEEIRGIIQQLQEINGENNQKIERSKNS